MAILTKEKWKVLESALNTNYVGNYVNLSTAHDITSKTSLASQFWGFSVCLLFGLRFMEQ